MANPELHPSAAASAVLDDAWDADTFPVDPFVISERLGLQVFYGNLPENVSGILQKDAGTATASIYVDRSDHPQRQRFTCAHELGHYVQRRDEAEFVGYVDRRDGRSQDGTDREEIFANAFAADLLMPEFAVRLLSGSGRGILGMTKVFDVSLSSMEFRLKNLGLRVG